MVKMSRFLYGINLSLKYYNPCHKHCFAQNNAILENISSYHPNVSEKSPKKPDKNCSTVKLYKHTALHIMYIPSAQINKSAQLNNKYYQKRR